MFSLVLLTSHNFIILNSESDVSSLYKQRNNVSTKFSLVDYYWKLKTQRNLYFVYIFDVIFYIIFFLSGKPHRCNVCDKRYKHKKHLTSHQYYECGKDPKFQCETCGKKYHQKYNLNLHFRKYNNGCVKK